MTAHDRRIIESAIAARLPHQPTKVTKCIRKLRPNSLAEFELRIQRFRVLYNVIAETAEVVLLIVGIKLGNKLIVEGTEFHGHRSDPPQPSAE